MSRCYICDVRLSDNEVVFNKDHNKYNPCYTCINASGPTLNERQVELDLLQAAADLEQEELDRNPDGSTQSSTD